MTNESFFSTLTAENADLHEAALNHPTVRGIGDGSLPEEIFRYYIEQDYSYLMRYIRVLSQAVVVSPDLETATRMAQLVSSTLSLEVDALIDLYAAFGGERDALDKVRRAPTCQAYTDHQVATAAHGNAFVILAAVLPCQWGYRDIGLKLYERGLPDDPRYARWISEYASDEYGELVDWAVKRFDELAVTESPANLEKAREAFWLSSYYEHRFWEMAWNREQW